MARIIFLIAFCIMLAAANVYAATHAVRPSTATDAVNGCANNGDGTSWACASSPGGVGARTTLPSASAWVRGDTYYFADGRYANVTIATATSGISAITLQKATTTTHGTSIGWQNSYGDGQAVFGFPIKVITSYVVFDGVVGSLSSNPNDYGFRVSTSTDCTLSENQMIGIPPIGYASLNISNVTISHVAAIECGPDYDTAQSSLYSNPMSASNMAVSHNYFDKSSSNILIRNWTNSTISNNYFASNWSSAHSHGQQLCPGNTSNITLSNNIFRNSTDFVVGAHYELGGNSGWNVFNNIINGAGYPGCTGAYCALTSCISNAEYAEKDSVVRWNVHHNTFLETDCGGLGNFFVGLLTNTTADRSYFYNNLVYKNPKNKIDNIYTYINSVSAALIHDYNAYYDCTDSWDTTTTEMHIEQRTGNPFLDSANGNYHLAAHTNAGTTLSSPFNVDLDGVTRRYFDRGAYEYVSGATLAPPAAPAGLTVH